MKDKTLKNIRLCCIVALAFCVVWAIFAIGNLFVNFLEDNASVHPVNWSVNSTIKIMVLGCYALGSISMICLCVIAIINTFIGIKENTVFPKSNVKLMFWIAIADFVYLLGYWNFPVLWKEDVVFQLQHTNFVSPFFLLFFAFMYKVAADAVEENNLTI